MRFSNGKFGAECSLCCLASYQVAGVKLQSEYG